MTRLGIAIAIVLFAASATVRAGEELDAHPQRWVPPMEGSNLPAGVQLSSALANYAGRQGWKVEWKLAEDYALDDELQLPGNNVVGDVQWVLKTYKSRGVMDGVGIVVNSELKRVEILRKDPLTVERDPVVEMRMSSLSHPGFQVTPNVEAGAGVMRPLAPLPIPQSQAFIKPAASRLVPIRAQEKDPNNPGLRLAPMPGMPFAPARDVRNDAALVAAREANRKLALRSAAQWEQVLQVATADKQTVDMAALLPPPAVVRELPTATASLARESTSAMPNGSPALSLGATATPPSALATSVSPKVSSHIKGVEAVEQPKDVAANVWSASNGTSIRTAVEAWAQRAGWVVRWDARIDYGVIGNLTFEGSFLDAVDKLFSAYSETARPLRADAYARQNLILVQE